VTVLCRLGLAFLLTAAAALVTHGARADAFERIRIGDEDGFGFASTAGLQRASYGFRVTPADTDGNGLLQDKEYLPDLDGDGGVYWSSNDNFDNRSLAERADAQHRCIGCLAVGTDTHGSNWTDLALSRSSRASDWPDGNGPAVPNNATFLFDFAVAKEDIPAGAPIFFNLVFADYDVYPALVRVEFAARTSRLLEIQHQGDRDGLIQARSDVLDFDEVFSSGGDGHWQGYVRVTFIAPYEPYTAFDFVELSLFRMAVSRIPADPAAPDPG